MESFLKEVAADLWQKFGLDIRNCAIVFNNKRPAVYLQKYLSEIIGKPFFSPSFFTIQDFVGNALDDKIADSYLQFFTLLEIYNELLQEEGAKELNSSQFYPLAKILLSDFNQIDNDLVDADALYKEMEDISTINLEFSFLTPEQYAFLSTFWESYSEGKHKKQQENFIKMWRRMPRLYHRFHETLAAQHKISHGGSYRKVAGMDIAQLSFLSQFEKVVFVGFNALSRSEEQLFVKLQDAKKSLFYFDVDDYYFGDSMQEAGYFLRKNILGLKLKNELQKPSGYFSAQPHKVDVYKVQGQSAQAKILNSVLNNEYIEDEEVGTTAIILADESLLLPALQTIPMQVNNKNIALNVTMGFPLAASSVLGLANLWLNCQTEMASKNESAQPKQVDAYISHHHLESFLTHPLLPITQAQRNKVRKAALDEKLLQVAQSRLVRQGGVFGIFFDKVAQPAELINALAKMLEYVLNALSSAGMLKKIDAQLLSATVAELNKLDKSATKFLRKEEYGFVKSLIQKSLTDIAIPLSGDPLNGIQVMGLLESRNLNFDKVVFVGFNEGIIPKSSLGNSFIPDSLRRAHGLPVLENLDSISSFIVLRLMQRARNISLIYNSLTSESTSGEPSRILKQLEYESNFQFTYHELELDIKAEMRREVIVDKKHPLIQQQLKMFVAKRRNISPSAITLYITNPIDFLFRYIAGIKEPEEVSATVEANELGSILHDAMESFYGGMVNKLVTKEWILLNKSSIEELIRKAFYNVRDVKDPTNYAFTGTQLLTLAVVKEYMEIILKADENYAPFTIKGLEFKIKTELPFKLKGKQESVMISGYIDRIDEKDGVTRIVDYKTGSDKLAYTDDLEQLFCTDGKHINKALIQTMIYAKAYEQQKGVLNVQPVLYVLKSMQTEGVVFKCKKSKLEAQFLEEFKPGFLQALGNKLAELFDEDIPFRASKIPENYPYSIYKTLFGA